MTVPKYINSDISEVNIGFFEFQAATLDPAWQIMINSQESNIINGE